MGPLVLVKSQVVSLPTKKRERGEEEEEEEGEERGQREGEKREERGRGEKEKKKRRERERERERGRKREVSFVFSTRRKFPRDPPPQRRKRCFARKSNFLLSILLLLVWEGMAIVLKLTKDYLLPSLSRPKGQEKSESRRGLGMVAASEEEERIQLAQRIVFPHPLLADMEGPNKLALEFHEAAFRRFHDTLPTLLAVKRLPLVSGHLCEAPGGFILRTAAWAASLAVEHRWWGCSWLLHEDGGRKHHSEREVEKKEAKRTDPRVQENTNREGEERKEQQESKRDGGEKGRDGGEKRRDREEKTREGGEKKRRLNHQPRGGEATREAACFYPSLLARQGRVVSIGDLRDDLECGRIVAVCQNLHTSFVTADHSIPHKEDAANGALLLRNQVQIALAVLIEGGMFVARVLGVNDTVTRQLLWVLFHAFQDVELVKPRLSDPWTVDKFIVCVGFLGQSQLHKIPAVPPLLWHQWLETQHTATFETPRLEAWRKIQAVGHAAIPLSALRESAHRADEDEKRRAFLLRVAHSSQAG